MKRQLTRIQEAEKMRDATIGLVWLAQDDPLAASVKAGRVCPYCDRPLPVEVREIFVPCWGTNRRQLFWPDRCGCPGETEALSLAEKRSGLRSAENRRSEHVARLKRAGLDGFLSTCTLDSFQRRADWPGAVGCKEAVEAYIDDLLSKQIGGKNWLVLCGIVGTGKTHLAAAIVRACIDAGWGEVFLRSWTAYTDRLKASWETDPKERTSAVQSELRDGRLVVIDDLDKKRPTDWTREILYPVLNWRYQNNLPTVLTFNMALTARDPNAPERYALEEYLGRAVFDRVMERVWAIVDFDGPSYRSGNKYNGWSQRKDLDLDVIAF